MAKTLFIYLISVLLVGLPFALFFYYVLNDGKSFLSLYFECSAIALLCGLLRVAFSRWFGSKN